MTRWIVLRTALVLVAVLMAGCSDGRAKTAPVRGKVMFNGKAVPNGTVLFIPQAGGPPATGEIQSDGTFTMTTYSARDGAVLGKHKVVIVAMQDNAGRMPEDRMPLPPPIIPSKYSSPATSTLSADVLDKDNTVNFDL